MPHGKVSPSVRITIQTTAPDIQEDFAKEERAWKETRGSKAGSRLPIGFIPAKFRAALFPSAEPDLFGSIGEIRLRTAQLRVDLGVLKDGSVFSGVLGRKCNNADTEFSGRSVFTLDIEISDSLDQLELFHEVVLGYKNKVNPLRVCVYKNGPERSELKPQELRDFCRRGGRIEFFLDDHKQVAVGAQVHGSSITIEGNRREYAWEFSEAPQLLNYNKRGGSQ